MAMRASPAPLQVADGVGTERWFGQRCQLLLAQAALLTVSPQQVTQRCHQVPCSKRLNLTPKGARLRQCSTRPAEIGLEVPSEITEIRWDARRVVLKLDPSETEEALMTPSIPWP